MCRTSPSSLDCPQECASLQKTSRTEFNFSPWREKLGADLFSLLSHREALTALDLRVYDSLLEIAIVKREKRALNREVWAGLEVLYHLMIRPLLNPDNKRERVEKCMEVQDQAVVYVDAFAAAVCRKFCTLYMHHVLTHTSAGKGLGAGYYRRLPARV
jgi:hypothetical protein